MNESKYYVHIDDNYHYMDETERRSGGVYDDCQAALAICKQIVDSSLTEQYQEGMTAEHLLRQYHLFGDDPWIASSTDDCKFSAWKYAERRCQEMCG